MATKEEPKAEKTKERSAYASGPDEPGKPLGPDVDKSFPTLIPSDPPVEDEA